MSTALQNITGDLTEAIEDIQAANVQWREHTECDAVHQRAARQESADLWIIYREPKHRNVRVHVFQTISQSMSRDQCVFVAANISMFSSDFTA